MSLANRYEEEAISTFAAKYPIAGQTIHTLVTDMGGIQELTAELVKKGFGGAMDGWLKAKKAKSMSVEQVKSFLDGSRLEKISKALGMTGEAVVSQIATYIPKLICQLGLSDDFMDYHNGFQATPVGLKSGVTGHPRSTDRAI